MLDSGGFGGFKPPPKVDFNYGAPLGDFMRSVQRTLVESPDFRGIGGHGLKYEPPHGLHSQVNIGIGDKTINFRKLL